MFLFWTIDNVNLVLTFKSLINFHAYSRLFITVDSTIFVVKRKQVCIVSVVLIKAPIYIIVFFSCFLESVRHDPVDNKFM